MVTVVMMMMMTMMMMMMSHWALALREGRREEAAERPVGYLDIVETAGGVGGAEGPALLCGQQAGKVCIGTGEGRIEGHKRPPEQLRYAIAAAGSARRRRRACHQHK
jgi:hypothetical protein